MSLKGVTVGRVITRAKGRGVSEVGGADDDLSVMTERSERWSYRWRRALNV